MQEPTSQIRLSARTHGWKDYLFATLTVGACAGLAWPVSYWQGPRNLVLFFVVAVVIIANRWSRGSAFYACLLSVFLFDYLYIPPYYELMPNDPEDWFTLSSMIVVVALISSTATLLRQSAKDAAERERIAKTISQFNRSILSTRTVTGLVEVAASNIQTVFGVRTRILLCSDETGELEGGEKAAGVDLNLCRKALENKSLQNTQTNASVVLPLLSATRALGVLIVSTYDGAAVQAIDTTLLKAVAEQLSMGLERAVGLETAEKAKLRVEGMKLRNSLLSSVSHDLRTPLASIMGAASTILSNKNVTLDGEQKQLIQSIYLEADRLGKFLKNLLDMTRIESGAVQLKREWQAIEESVGVALGRLSQQLAPFTVRTEIPVDLPLANYDEHLIDQVLFNLLDNAAKYAPKGSTIVIHAEAEADGVKVCVSNIGCTLPPGAETKMFDKFFRGDASSAAVYGAGLGLTICRGILQAHGGHLWAERFDDTGLRICFMIPKTGEPPVIESEEMEAAEA